MSSETVLRLDRKGRIGLASLSRSLEERLGGYPISGYSARITEDGAILLRPRVEVDAAEAATLLLSDPDRDALFAALADPPPPSASLRAAAEDYQWRVLGE